MDATRAVMITYDGVDDVPRRASGLHLRGGLVLTGEHCARGKNYQVWLGGENFPAGIVWRSHTLEVDLAVLLSNTLPEVEPLTVALLDRTTVRELTECRCLCYPKAKGDGALQIIGSIPLAENQQARASENEFLGTAPASLNVDHTKTTMPAQVDDWASASGGGVVATYLGNEYCVGVISAHNVKESPSSLRVADFASVEALPAAKSAKFWSLVGVNGPDRLAVLGGRPVAAVPYEPIIASFLAQYLGRAGAQVPFGGRDDDLTRLDNWLGDPSRPRLLLVGSAGIGKSALLARWLARRPMASIYVPITLRYGLAREVPVLRALGARLAAVHGETAPDGDADQLRDAVSRLLAKPMPKGLLVVTDGLDEAEAWIPGPGLFGGELGQGVKVVAAARSTATRPEASDWRNTLGWPDPETMELTLRALDRNGVADVLATAPQPVGALALDDALVDKFEHLTAGDPLVLGLYIGELLNCDSAALAAAIDRLPDQPKGLDDVFTWWWEGQRQLWDARGQHADRTVWATLDILACARGPLRRTELIAIVGCRHPIDGDVLDDVLRSLDRFIVQSGDPAAFSLAHPRLAGHRRRRLADDGKLAAVNETIRDWCLEVFAAAVSGHHDKAMPYAVTHLGDHLEMAGADASAFDRLVHPAWQEAWNDTVDEWFGYTNEVRRAIRVATAEAAGFVAHGQDSAAAAIAVRCTLVQAELSGSARLISGELALQLVLHGVWSASRAAQAVLALEHEGALVRGLAVLSPRLGPESLATALDRVNTIDPVGWWVQYGQSLGALAARLADLDGVRAAVAMLTGMPAGTSRAIAVLSLLRARPDTAHERAATSLLIDELAAIRDGLNPYDAGEVIDRVADSISAHDFAAALGDEESISDTAITFLRRCIAHPANADLASHLDPWTLGVVAPWLDPAHLESALTELVDDVENLRDRDRNGNTATTWFDSAGDDTLADSLGGNSRELDIRIWTRLRLEPVAHRLPPNLARRALGFLLPRLSTGWRDEELGALVVTTAERLDTTERHLALAPLLDHLEPLLLHGGRIDKRQDIAAGLARTGHSADIFRAAAADDDQGRWYDALEQAAPHLDEPSMNDAVRLTDTLNEMYRQWVLKPLLARLASFGPTQAHQALRMAASPAGGHAIAAADALRSAVDVAPATCEPLALEPAISAKASTVVATLLKMATENYDAIRGIIELLPSLTIERLTALAHDLEQVVRSVTHRNALRGPVAVRLARLGALDAALDVFVDPYVGTRRMEEILHVTPAEHLGKWFAAVHRAYSGDLHPTDRADLMAAAASRVAACDRRQAWNLLSSWLKLTRTHTERLIDLRGYAPAIHHVASASATEQLAAWIQYASASPSVPA